MQQQKSLKANADSQMGGGYCVNAKNNIVSAFKLCPKKFVRGIFISIFIFNNNFKMPQRIYIIPSREVSKFL